jgi:HEAT repeat protein
LHLAKLTNKNNLAEEKKFHSDPVEIKHAKQVLKSFGKAFFALKIYPTMNPSVQKSIDTFLKDIKEFLNVYKYLKIGVGEFSFTYKGDPAFQDEEKKRSLPFLLFKDGMRELIFLEGLDEEEILEFLKVIKEGSELPPEDSDIVNFLWEKDFAHIRYFALDEFLETDIGQENNKIYVKIDKNKFSEGKVNFTPEDRIELYKRGIALGFHSANDKHGEDNGRITDNLVLPSHITVISEEEIPEVKTMVSESRAASRLNELVNLLFEILFLEERYDRFLAILNVVNQCYLEIIHKSDFTLALFLLNRLQELKETLTSQLAENKKSLERLLQDVRNISSMSRLRKLFLAGRIKNFESFFQYLKFLGPNTIPLLGDIWEHSEDTLIREKASDFLQDYGQKDINTLIKIARDDRLALSREVIAILGRMGDRGVLPYLEKFASHEDKTLRLATIHALKRIEDEDVNKILLKLLDDQRSEVRTLATQSLKYYGDKTTFGHVLELAKRKDFKKRNKIEKKALLKFLAKSQSEEVYSLLRSFLKKWTIFSKSVQNEIRLSAVCALEAMANPKAAQILEEGTRLRNKKIREACRLSLMRLTF